ncbi:hypothetical protein [Parasitella parasitica]|uniref:Chromo domain-containing protein n=1 Tax=Parasitella parasitica TaxID=35722 RepID=A0A0B7N132_9FUNG|nr:hypothetical protein [Parasitella parasitica]
MVFVSNTKRPDIGVDTLVLSASNCVKCHIRTTFVSKVLRQVEDFYTLEGVYNIAFSTVHTSIKDNGIKKLINCLEKANTMSLSLGRPVRFEKLNNSRKNPIKLTKSPPTPKQIPTVISADSSSPSASVSNSTIPTNSANINGKQQQTLDGIFGTSKGKGKEKEEVLPVRLPQVIATANNEDDDMDDDVPLEIMEIESSDDEDAFATPNRSSDQLSSPSADEMDTENTTPKSATSKRAMNNDSKQQDYFLEQHEKKRKREELGIDDDSSVESMSPPPKHKTAVIDIEEIQDDEDVIFNEKFAIDPPLDWYTQTERVEYIGKEIDQSDLYCLVRWKDGVKSIHPLTLVREKRPDLVIDRFIEMALQK